MRVRIRHESRYHFPKPALLGPHLIRLRPADHANSPVQTYNLHVSPEPEVRWQLDPANNHIARCSWKAGQKTEELSVLVDATIDVRPMNPFDFFTEDYARDMPITYAPHLQAELAPYMQKPTLGALTSEFVASIPKDGYITDWVVELNRRVAETVNYIIRNEAGIYTAEETLVKGRGSCRDSAVLLVDVLRAHGLAARFVSGYLIQLIDEGDIPGERKGVAKDVIDLHAWAEVYVPGGGWIGLDGTSGLLCAEGHIPLCCTVEPPNAAPIVGSSSEAGDLTVTMEIERLGHEPTPRRPYTEEQWQSLREAGRKTDQHLMNSGLRMTMGGEPTWVSREFPREPEWNETALGPTKWTLGLKFAREIQTRIASGVLVMLRQGKHYPGESLPRWTLHLIWRKDGRPVWHDPSRLAWHDEQARNLPNELSAKDSERFILALARRLGLSDVQPVPGFEDPWVHIVQEENYPPDVDPMKADLDSPEERKRLSKILGQGLKKTIGYALPISRSWGRWISSSWAFRREHMYLIPGDSPMGLRLPLNRLGGKEMPWFEQDPTFIDRRAELKLQDREEMPPLPDTPAGTWGNFTYGSTMRTAVVAEVREGALHVFLPPLPSSEDFLELIMHIEDTAVETGLRVRVEGYPPPFDPRLGHCLVTPDPGVLEVNVPPTDDFDEYSNLIEMLAEAGRHAGLRTMKFQLDGREAGTGGGHHLTFGGPSPLESPFLRRPDILGSVLRYFQNHPSLSYLFSGLFVGPTSQAPRIDEARHDSLYELEIALSRIPKFGSGELPPPPWLIDRLLRNILVDIEGNTHRTEICIDKLYEPRSSSGRQGLIELRAFEMPPHERMAVAQMLLVRSLIAMFAAQPYERSLVRWGSELHDRFMLPHYLWADFEDVLNDLQKAGLPLDPAWFRPFVELRCPILGTMTAENVTIELRSAIEPWHVLGEEGFTAGTVRHVDSSLERVEIRVDGVTEGRQLVMVNGLVLPLRKTGRAAERVAGVRFRAWQPPFCLQPTIGIHHPLRFDVVDTWGRRSLGACTYHVWHPQGRAYDDPPITIHEAAARRSSRFTPIGHAPYPVIPNETRVEGEQPYTLDLRQYPFDRRYY